MFNIVGRGIGGNDKFESERVGDPEEVVGIASIDFAREDGVFRGPRAFAGTSSLRIPGKVRALDQLPDAGPEIPPIADHGDRAGYQCPRPEWWTLVCFGPAHYNSRGRTRG